MKASKDIAKRVLWGGLRHIPLRGRRQILYWLHHGRWPQLGANAELFTEKMQRRILFDHRPLIGDLGDKLKMKERAAQFPDVKIARTCWCGTNLDELVLLSEFPDRWVLKPTNASGKVILGEGRPNIGALKCQTSSWLPKVSSLWRYRGEWIYSTAKPGILLEERLGGESAPEDYKFFVFRGDVAVIQVDTARFTHHQRRFYTSDWKPLEIRTDRDVTPVVMPAPPSLDKMLTIASKMGAEFDFIRVDLYDIDGDVWFGELSPYGTSGGLAPFEPLEWDRELGRRWRMDIAN